MEIKYSYFEPDNNVFGKCELTGMIDPNDKYIYNNIYDIKDIKYDENKKVFFYLYFGEKKAQRELIKKFYHELELSPELMNRPLKKLSDSELIKIIIIKLLNKNVKTIILNHIETYLTQRDVLNILKIIKNNKDKINKNVIFNANKVDNILFYVDKYLIINEDKIIYNGSNFEEIPISSEIKKFTDYANSKGAKIKNYKETNDLLKAIYRSVKK